MALTCSRCGTQNPDSNRFCQNCGAQLAASSPAPAPTPVAPPAPAPTPSATPPSWAPSSTYYTPSQPVTLRRLPVGLIAGAVVALLILMSGVAVVAAAIAKGTVVPGDQTGRTFTPAPSSVPPSPITGGNASPSPVAPPSPVSSPSPTPTSAPTGQGSVCNSTLCLTPAQGWTVKSKDDTSVLLAYDNPVGFAHFQALKPGSPVKAIDELQRLFDGIKKQSPDATICQQAQDLTVGGNKGPYIIACFTFTPQGGQAIKIVELLWIAVSADGTVEYEWDAFSTDSNFDNFLKAVNPLQHTVQWKI